MAHPKNQHYVPKILLNFFSSKEAFIWAYDKAAKAKNWKIIKERPITRVASEHYFYDQVENNKDFSFEYELGKIERETLPIIEKLISKKTIKIITDLEKEKLAYFIAFQLIRTKWQLSKVKAYSTDFIEKVNEAFETQQEPFDYKALWFSLFEEAVKFSKAIKNKVWFLGQSENIFYTSDNPVVLQNSTDQSEIRGSLGLESYGIEIYMPLTDSLILCMFCEKLLKNKHETLDLEIFNYENVINVNSLQYFQSERFIFSSSGKFEMIDESIDI